MHITVKRIDSSACADVRLPNEPFPLCGRMLPAYDGQWSYTVTMLPPQERSEMVFPDEVYDFEAMAQDYIFIGAYTDDGVCVGLAVYRRSWNRYMYLHDLKVNAAYRRPGIGRRLLEEGKTDKECLAFLTEDYLVMPHKAALALKVAKAERKILDNRPEEISLYIGIPFCPTRCLYCSFTAYPLHQYKNRVDEYLDAMFRELDWLAAYSRSFVMKNIYIGGGTPTSLNEAQLERLLQKVEELFHPDESMEYTVEAGRPDTITREKLRLLKEYGVNRISINPQTMNDKTLRAVGRKHTVEDIRRVFREAREEGHQNINMDLILGLPGEDAADVRNTMEEIMKLAPDNVTMHTLAVKRASRLREELAQHDMTTAEALEEMLDISAEYAERMGMEPYYMYRQKNMVGNFENVGYCHPGKEGIYNVQIMEEKQTILAAGAGASTKTVDPETDRIERVFNVKSIEDYIGRIEEMIERKRTGLPQGGNI